MGGLANPLGLARDLEVYFNLSLVLLKFERDSSFSVYNAIFLKHWTTAGEPHNVLTLHNKLKGG